MPPRNFSPILLRVFSLLIALSLILSGCLPDNPVIPDPANTQAPQPTPLPEALMTFRVKLPEPAPSGDEVFLTVLDEVTGLALNPTHYVMKAESATLYSVILPFPVNSVVKYRYTRQGSSFVQEHISDGRAVHYRLLHVEGPGMVEDTLSRWTDTGFQGPTGRVSGQVLDAASGSPIPSLLVTAGGANTLTASDGSFLLEGLPPGTHNLVVYSLDGSYDIYQQGAVIAADSTTPAAIRLNPAQHVKVVFVVSVPAGTVPPTVPVRLAGNLLQLGNTYGDLLGGVNSLASRMPALTPLPDGRYSITLELPVGADIRYKYTLGDGLWNAEHANDASFQLREMIVPATSIQVEDRVAHWNTGRSAPITFDITVPANTPPADVVSVQFNPGFGWMEPIPMWPVGGNRWIYVLYSPLDTLGSINYRYCRNDQCGSADDVRTAGPQAVGHSVSTSLLAETMDDTVEKWTWLEETTETATLPNVAVHSHGPTFIAGVSLDTPYHPSWEPYLPQAFADIKSMNANWVVISPSWTFTRLNLPVLEPIAGRNPLWADLAKDIHMAQGQGLNVALFPIALFPSPASEWWQSAPHDFGWWVVWFDRYRNFILTQADLAQQQGAGALILGGEWLTPALPGGLLQDGSPSGVPADGEARWRGLIQDVRAHYKGALLWALPYPQGVQNPPPFLNDVDQIYLLWSAPLATQAGVSEIDMAGQAGQLLDQQVRPLQQQTGKPVIMAIAYPSAIGGLTGCLPAGGGGCWSMDALSRPNPDLPEITLNLQEQVQAYNAIFLAVNERDWISGVVSRGYYPPVALQDKSTSVHGKLARGVLWYWFPRLMGIQ